MKRRHSNQVAAVIAAVVLMAGGAQAQTLEYVHNEPMPELADVQATCVAMSPDGLHVYAVCGRGDALVAMHRDTVSGQLSLIEVEIDNTNGVDGLETAASVAVSADGSYVYVAGAEDDAMAVFARDALSGEVEFIEAKFDNVDGMDGLLGAHLVAVSPDAQNVYVAGASEDAVAVFMHVPPTGDLELMQVVRDGVGGVQGLTGVVGFAVSPDGAHAYASGFNDDAVAVFDRDSETGMLAFKEVHVNEVDGVDGLDGISAVTVSPDGLNVYTVSLFRDGPGPPDGENALSVFDRDPETGRLTFREAHFDDENGVDGLAQAASVLVHPEGLYVYVAAVEDNALAVFERFPSTGALEFVEAYFDGVDGAEGLEGARCVAVSPAGRNLYVASILDSSVSAWRQQPCPGDTNGTGIVNVGDLLAVILDWGTDGSANNGDVDDDGDVDVNDLIAVIGAWGVCPS